LDVAIVEPSAPRAAHATVILHVAASNVAGQPPSSPGKISVNVPSAFFVTPSVDVGLSIDTSQLPETRSTWTL
jgi:hypothetical protein